MQINPADAVFPLALNEWRSAPGFEVQRQAIAALEQGGIIFLPNLPFTLTPEEQCYLRPDCVKPGIKSIKYSKAKKRLWGTAEVEENSPVLMSMLERYADDSRALIEALFPVYAAALAPGNTSFRPVEAEGRAQSKRHDDRLLHVDAFPSRPNGGERILRVFSNIHPGAHARKWRVGEPFAVVAARFLPSIRPPLPGSAKLLKALKITKGLRSYYDHLMLRLHDTMKLDDEYQITSPRQEISFPPGSSWVVYTDQVSHAALAGQHAMEQSFSLPVAAMQNPELSPLRILERLSGRKAA